MLVFCLSAVGCGGSETSEPVLRSDEVEVREDGEVSVDVLANDRRVDGRAPTLVEDPSHGRATVRGRSIFYRAAAEYHGDDRFSYSVTGADAGRAEVRITVRSVNDPPEVSDDRASVTAGREVRIDVLANDELQDGPGPLTVDSVSSPADGRASVVEEGAAVRYAAPDEPVSAQRFDYVAADGDGGTSQATVTVEVGRDDPPKAVDDSTSVTEGGTTEIDVLANDTEPEDQPLSITSVGGVFRGSISADDGALSYEAPESFNGSVRLEYEVADPAGHTNSAAVRIGVYRSADEGAPVVHLPRSSIRRDELAVVVNSADSYSSTIGMEYARERQIPSENVVSVKLPTGKASISRKAFSSALSDVESSLPDGIQAYALAWLEPYRVECMSITSAFAFGGFDRKFCSSPCARTAWSDYYASDSVRPHDDHGIRPAMLLAARKLSEGRALVDRGVKADDTFPGGTGFLIRTTDDARSTRASDFQLTANLWDDSGALDVRYRDNADGSGSNVVKNRSGVLFYLTGSTRVKGIETNDYRPGAIADHLTSFAGKLTNFGGQMSALEWLEAGATASYGTVVEPCNFPSKFPRASVLTEHYFRGQTAVGAYWKSVATPGEGVFIGEPLASPWGRSFLKWEGETLTIRTTHLAPKTSYRVVARQTAGTGDWMAVRTGIEIDSPREKTITIPSATAGEYALRSGP
ncbi:MAG: TIGR03790 family protein [Bradymonadaceae bacterium]